MGLFKADDNDDGNPGPAGTTSPSPMPALMHNLAA